MKVFLTGATGFIGYTLLKKLLQTGVDIKVLVRSSSDVTRLVGTHIDVVEGDIRDADLLFDAIRGCRRVYHVAANHSFCGTAEDFDATNVQGTLNVLRAAMAADVERVVYTSSAGAVGAAQGGGLADEESEWNLQDVKLPYIRSKRKAEEQALALAKGRLDLVVVNPTAAVGAYDSRPTPMGQWIVRYLRSRAALIPQAELNLVDVDAVASGHILAMERGKPGRRYILGGENTTSKAYFSTLAAIAGLRQPWTLSRYLFRIGSFGGRYFRKGGLRGPCGMDWTTTRLLGKKLHYSSDRAKNELGWSPGNLEDASRKALRWFCRNGYIHAKRARDLLKQVDSARESETGG